MESNKAIGDAGYENVELKYEEPTPKKSKRLRKIYYFNPPFAKNMSSDLTKMFNHIMLKNFPKSHELHKLINKNNNKISYSCTPNMSMIIAGHNKKLLKNTMKILVGRLMSLGLVTAEHLEAVHLMETAYRRISSTMANALPTMNLLRTILGSLPQLSRRGLEPINNLLIIESTATLQP